MNSYLNGMEWILDYGRYVLIGMGYFFGFLLLYLYRRESKDETDPESLGMISFYRFMGRAILISMTAGVIFGVVRWLVAS